MMKIFVLQQQKQQEEQRILSERVEQQFLQQHGNLMLQSKFLETVLQKFAEGNSSTITFTSDAVANSISEFTYNSRRRHNFCIIFQEI